MKVRSQLSAAEVSRMREELGRRLAQIGVASQPEVVLRLLELSARPDAQVNDFAKVIRTDHAVSGRVLKLANSSYFAQRAPVTSLERACVVLGLERLKAVSLGFQLSRAAGAGAAGDELARRVWTQSVMRACVAAELARVLAPGHVAEAFVIGLMADAGVPLMPRLLGAGYDANGAGAMAPAALYRVESDAYPFTHVDVVSALASAWKLPALLARPLDLHHAKPPMPLRDETPARLHAIAFVAGMLHVRAQEDEEAPPDVSSGGAAGVLGMGEEAMREVVRRSAREYGATVTMFRGVASSLGEGEDLMETIHHGLVRASDAYVLASLERERREAEVIQIGGQTIQATREPDGAATLVLFDATGAQLVTHRFPPGQATAASVLDALGMERVSPEDELRLGEYLRSRAA